MFKIPFVSYWCKSKKLYKIFLWKQRLASNWFPIIMIIHNKIPFWNKLEMSKLDIIFFFPSYNSWRADPWCMSLVFRTIDWVVDLNRRPGKTRTLGKSGIFLTWEKAQKDDTHRYSHTYTRTYIPTYHVPLDKVGFWVMGCIEGVLRSMKEFCLQHGGKWSRNIQKERKIFCICLSEVFGTLQWGVGKNLVFRKWNGMSFIICIAKKFEHLEIWYDIKSRIWGHFLSC